MMLDISSPEIGKEIQPCSGIYSIDYIFLSFFVQGTTRITETGITNLTRITNEMATSSDYLMKYFNGILAVLLE